jgi:5-methyltetrahydrofolate corrinoid/iron sulfur protein methyltransferase
MLIIGENIQIMSPTVRAAIEARDASFIQNLAKRQAQAGADFIDMNVGPQKKAGIEVVSWMVDTVQAVTDKPLSFDTTNAPAIEAGLQKVKRQAMINSTSADPDRMANVMPLVQKYKTKVIALAMGKEGIPPTADGRVELAMNVLLPAAEEWGVPISDMFVDPLTLTVVGMQDHAMHTLNAVRFFKQVADPPPMTVVGLSNVSNQVPTEGRSLINRTFLVMLMSVGLDAAILNPMDEEQNKWMGIVQRRDDSTPLGKLLLTLHDRTAAMDELTPDDVDMKDEEQVGVWKTYQILTNKVIYAESYLRI